MIYFSLFLLAVFLVNGKWVFRAPFSIASWSLTFPMAALTIASLLFFPRNWLGRRAMDRCGAVGDDHNFRRLSHGTGASCNPS